MVELEFKPRQFFSRVITHIVEEMHYFPLESRYIHLSSDIKWLCHFFKFAVISLLAFYWIIVLGHHKTWVLSWGYLFSGRDTNSTHSWWLFVYLFKEMSYSHIGGKQDSAGEAEFSAGENCSIWPGPLKPSHLNSLLYSSPSLLTYAINLPAPKLL